MTDYEAAYIKIINDLDLHETTSKEQKRLLRITLQWLYNKGAANAIKTLGKKK